jgi:hypothetical protein
MNEVNLVACYDDTTYSRISSSGTSISQLNSPAQRRTPLNHRELYGERDEKEKESVPFRSKSLSHLKDPA